MTSRTTVKKSPAPSRLLLISPFMQRIKIHAGTFYIKYILSYQAVHISNAKSIAASSDNQTYENYYLQHMSNVQNFLLFLR